MCGVHALRGQHNGIIRSREALYGGFVAVYQHDGNIAIVYNILLAHDNIVALADADGIHAVAFYF